MKPLFTVVLFVLFHLTGSAVHLYSGTSRVVFTTKESGDQVGMPLRSKEFHLEKVYNLNQQTPDLLVLEDEDDQNMVKTHIRTYCAFFSDVFFPFRYTRPKDCLSAGSHLTCTVSRKYIFQRALRI